MGELTEIRRTIIKMAGKAQEGHIPSALSILDILWVLYDDVLRINANDPLSEERDRFVLSKGHAAIGLFAVLAEKGFFAKEELLSFCTYASRLGGHPDSTKVPGVEASTGSLGHGFPMAAGMAMGLRIRSKEARVFCLIGDGEANEGSIWETALMAAHHQLTNLCCIVDYNHSTDRALNMGDIMAKFNAFDWSVSEVDGHDHAQLRSALNKAGHGNRPVCIVANTIKGFGCGIMESDPAWHHRSPKGDEELARVLETVR